MTTAPPHRRINLLRVSRSVPPASSSRPQRTLAGCALESDTVRIRPRDQIQVRGPPAFTRTAAQHGVLRSQLPPLRPLPRGRCTASPRAGLGRVHACSGVWENGKGGGARCKGAAPRNWRGSARGRPSGGCALDTGQDVHHRTQTRWRSERRTQRHICGECDSDAAFGDAHAARAGCVCIPCTAPTAADHREVPSALARTTRPDARPESESHGMPSPRTHVRLRAQV